MNVNSFFRKMSDGFEVWVNRWEPDNKDDIKGVIQLHHGLSEHSMRYDRLGSILVENGFVLNAYDMRGHGKTAENSIEKKTGKMGKLADKDGFKRVMQDLDEMIDEDKKEYPDKPVYLLAHSFGSLIGQYYIEEHSDKIAGCILSGTSGPKGKIIILAQFLSRAGCLFAGKDTVRQWMYNVTFANYNKKVQNPKTDIDWVSASEQNVQMYLADQWCGTPLTNSFYVDMADLVATIQKRKNIEKIRKDLPVMFVYGCDDPVGSYGKSIKKLIEIYKDTGISQIIEKGYEGLRHEILNEDSKEIVENDILNWLKSNLTK